MMTETKTWRIGYGLAEAPRLAEFELQLPSFWMLRRDHPGSSQDVSPKVSRYCLANPRDYWQFVEDLFEPAELVAGEASGLIVGEMREWLERYGPIPLPDRRPPGMTRDEQGAFVLELMKSVQTDVQALITSGKVPEEWNGIELRQLLADKFRESTHPMPRVRRRAYEQAVLAKNL